MSKDKGKDNVRILHLCEDCGKRSFTQIYYIAARGRIRLCDDCAKKREPTFGRGK